MGCGRHRRQGQRRERGAVELPPSRGAVGAPGSALVEQAAEKLFRTEWGVGYAFAPAT
jgi:hypothetical protein